METTHLEAQPDLLNPDVLRKIGEETNALYEREIRPKVEPAEIGRKIAIHLETGDYTLGGTDKEARRALRLRHPDGFVMTRIVGENETDGLATRMVNRQGKYLGAAK